MQKPVCSLSLDLDNKWSYMKTHGDTAWQTFPSYLELVVPRVIELLTRRNWTITFFVVGQDAVLASNREPLASISAAGHEIGNHSFSHEPWLHLYDRQQTEDEIAHAEEAIESATGVRPVGFRGPGYSISHATLRVLADRDYRYDASTMPTYLGPLARAYYFRTANLTRQEREKRAALFGGFREGLRPVKPHRWRLDGKELLEIPVSTIPVLKTPFHFSYLLYLGTFSFGLARLYFRAALGSCRVTRTEPSLLLHPLDFLGSDDVPDLMFFPAMNTTSSQKLANMHDLLQILDARYRVLSMSQHMQHIVETGNLPVRAPHDLP